jgi:hypothetical protein
MKVLHLISALFAALLLQTGFAQAAIKTQYVDYKDGNTPLKGYLAYDDSKTGKRPGVLLVHYRGGLQGETLKDAEMIASLGYVVFAEDIFGVATPPKTVPEMTALTDVYNKNRPLMRTRSRSGFDELAKNAMVDASKIAVIGYCFGGTVAVELGETGIPALGVVAVHGSFRDFQPEAAKNLKGRVSDPARRGRRSRAAHRGEQAGRRSARRQGELGAANLQRRPARISRIRPMPPKSVPTANTKSRSSASSRKSSGSSFRRPYAFEKP